MHNSYVWVIVIYMFRMKFNNNFITLYAKRNYSNFVFNKLFSKYCMDPPVKLRMIYVERGVGGSI